MLTHVRSFNKTPTCRDKRDRLRPRSNKIESGFGRRAREICRINQNGKKARDVKGERMQRDGERLCYSNNFARLEQREWSISAFVVAWLQRWWRAAVVAVAAVAVACQREKRCRTADSR